MIHIPDYPAPLVQVFWIYGEPGWENDDLLAEALWEMILPGPELPKGFPHGLYDPANQQNHCPGSGYSPFFWLFDCSTALPRPVWFDPMDENMQPIPPPRLIKVLERFLALEGEDHLPAPPHVTRSRVVQTLEWLRANLKGEET